MAAYTRTNNICIKVICLYLLLIVFRLHLSQLRHIMPEGF